MSDYFSLVEGGGADIDCRRLEGGLAAVASNVDLYAPQAERYANTILQRFVYAETDRCSPKATSIALGILKALGRQTSGASAVASQQAIGGLLELARTYYVPCDSADTTPYVSDICSDALTCIANAMLLHPECRSRVAEHQCLDNIAKILGATNGDLTVEFLCARCLLLALGTKEAAQYCVEQHGLQNVLAQTAQAALNADGLTSAANSRFTPQQVLAEVLKAALSLCTYSLQWIHDTEPESDSSFPQERAIEFAALLDVSLRVLCNSPLEAHHLSSAAKQAVGIAMDFSTNSSAEIRELWLPGMATLQNVDAIYDLLKGIVSHTTSESSETGSCADNVISEYQDELTPLALVLTRLATEHPDARQRLFLAIYPEGTIDYSELPENRPGLSAKLVRLMKTPHGGMLPGAIGDLLLALLGHDIKQFIMAVGYGNAAGYMVARNIAIPSDIIEQVKQQDDESASVDPITGRYWDQEGIDRELASMTDEEKEREAERLFVLFERLNKTGVIKVENPIRAA
ncbi:hypothetical protein IWW55_002402, partial [Coemansia sp. RSA 2706]